MKISTVVVVRIVSASTLVTLTENSGNAANAIIPRCGEFIEIRVSGEDKLFKVVRIGHKFTESYRNIITMYVDPAWEIIQT